MGAIALALASGCANVQVQTDHDPGADFGRYRTFQVAPGQVLNDGKADQGDTLVQDRVRNAIVSQLAAKGLRPLQGNEVNPDLVVTFVAGARTRQEVETVSYPWGPYWGPSYAPDAWVRLYRQGTLIIDLVDPDTERTVYRARVESDNKPFTDPKIVQKAVAKALQKFPSQAKG
jgi:hypothetical protein